MWKKEHMLQTPFEKLFAASYIELCKSDTLLILKQIPENVVQVGVTFDVISDD